MTMRFAALMLCTVLLTLPAAAAAGDTGRERSAAPYLEAWADGQRLESLPLASTRVEAVIGGVIADVRVTQVYENRGDRPVEAVYVFPASSRASVHAVTMTIGDRVVRAQLRERGQARREYDAARAGGRTATLLEQQDVGAFRMNVANVLPGDRIEVEMQYVELLVPTAGVYEFFFPTTAPQVAYTRPGDPDVAMPASPASGVVDHAMTMRVHVLSGLPISRIESPSHPIQAFRPREGEAVVTIDPADTRAMARDFVLRYAMQGDDIGTGVLAFRDGGENYFLLTAQPPARIAPAAIPPREYIFVIDVSGSMAGRPLAVSKKLVRDLFATLKPGDRFNVVLFAGDSSVMSEQSLPATPETLRLALETLDDAGAGGGTELASALERAQSVPPTPGMSRTLVIVTDGAIAAGGDVAARITDGLDQANVFVFGIGDYLDHAVIERLARAGQGEPFKVMRMKDADAEAQRLRAYIERPVLTQARLRWDGADLYDLEPARLPDLFAERPIVVVGKFRGELAGTATIQGYSGGRPVTLSVDLSKAYTDPALSSLPKLWARRRIDRLMDTSGCAGAFCAEDHPARREILETSLQHGLLTPFTSFIAVTGEVRTNEAGERVFQPAPQRDVAEPGGFGFDPLLAAAALAAPVVAPPPVVSGEQWLAGHRMQQVEGGWRDAAHRDDARVLRIRRGSEAHRELLRLRPDLAAVFALPGRVLVSFGGTSILLAEDGFSDFPPGQLAGAVGAR